MADAIDAIQMQYMLYKEGEEMLSKEMNKSLNGCSFPSWILMLYNSKDGLSNLSQGY